MATKGSGGYHFESGKPGEPIYAVWDNGFREPAYESSLGMNAGSETPYMIPKSLVDQYQGKVTAASSDPFANTALFPTRYAPAIFRQSKNTLLDQLGPLPLMAPAVMGLAGAGLAGGEIAGGAGVDVLAGGGADVLAGEFTGGLTGAATGSPGLAAPGGFSASALGAGGASAVPGLAATGAAGTALAPGFFAAETMSPLLGAAAGSAAAGGTAGGAAGAVGAGSILSNPALLGAGLGAAGSLLGSGNSPAGNVTTTQDIPEWLKGYAKAGMGGLMDAFQAAPGGVNPLTSQGAGYLSDVIGGDYLNSNPYLDAMFNRAAGQVGSRVNSQFTSAGRYGSGAHQGVLGETLGNLATDIYGGNYTRERANQQAAALGSGAFGNMMIDQPFRPAQNLLSGVGSIKGGTTTSPYFNNQFGDLLSGAMGGALLGKMFS